MTVFDRCLRWEASVVVLMVITIAGLVVGAGAVLWVMAAEREHRIHQAEQARLEAVRRQLAEARRQSAIDAGRPGKPSARRAA